MTDKLKPRHDWGFCLDQVVADTLNGDTIVIGQTIDDRYHIEALIGRGGMGAVYRGTDLTENHQAESKSLWNLMLLQTCAGNNPQQAISYGEQSLAIARQHNLQEQLAYALHDLAQAYVETGRTEEQVPSLYL